MSSLDTEKYRIVTGSLSETFRSGNPVLDGGSGVLDGENGIQAPLLPEGKTEEAARAGPMIP